jgi:hypothetical protein
MSDSLNANGKRVLQEWELLRGLACETEAIAKRAEATAKRNQDLAELIVKAAKDTNALAREARFSATQAMAKAKQAMPEGAKLEDEAIDPGDEEATIKAEQEAMNADEAGATFPLTGFCDDGNAANVELEGYFQNDVFKFESGTYEATGQVEQVIVPGPRGRRNDVFEQKELFKSCTPRFFFNGTHKNWRRVAPPDWAPSA